ncbi:MAG: hypothetical protein HZB33_14845, partial [Nitrospirae bacterium]|nr:hypothetical protein [Nitrospirota bacterium]
MEIGKGWGLDMPDMIKRGRGSAKPLTITIISISIILFMVSFGYASDTAIEKDLQLKLRQSNSYL